MSQPTSRRKVRPPAVIDTGTRRRWQQIIAGLGLPSGHGTVPGAPVYKHEPPRPARRKSRSVPDSAARVQPEPEIETNGLKQWRWVLRSPRLIAGSVSPRRGDTRPLDPTLTDAWEFLFEGPPDVVDRVRTRLELTELHFDTWLRRSRPRMRPETRARACQIALGYLALSSPCLAYLGFLWALDAPQSNRAGRRNPARRPGARFVRSVHRDLGLFRRSALYREQARLRRTASPPQRVGPNPAR